jgi:DNA repair protein RadD
MVGVSARPFSKSLSSHVQQMGRVMRPCDGKDFALWLDHSGNYLRFAEDWDEVYQNGVTELDDGREKPKKEPSEKEKAEAKCPRCSRFMARSMDVCPSCGYTRPQRNNVLERPGELQEYAPDGKRLPARDERQAFFSQLCAIAIERGYKRGWAFHKFREKYGVEPKGLREDPMAQSASVERWVRSRQIAWAKGRQSQQQAVAA